MSQSAPLNKDPEGGFDWIEALVIILILLSLLYFYSTKN
jgi:hypothetical protein